MNMAKTKEQTQERPQDILNKMGKEPSGFNYINIKNILDIIEVVDTAPTKYPKKFWDSIKLYSNGGTYKIYFYINNIGWKSATLT